MGPLLQRLGVELPIVQAGMGGGLADHELAAAVADAGGLGTIGILGPEELRAEIAAVRRVTEDGLSQKFWAHSGNSRLLIPEISGEAKLIWPAGRGAGPGRKLGQARGDALRRRAPFVSRPLSRHAGDEDGDCHAARRL